ncbi:DUF2314 domain-containing protein [Orbus wheelerorum]|uniref:DUF2314 domain-containing protein n=1 Tax=Orbus wheelerorum TaxID=3074111 RepID=UPI00370DDF9F
MYTLDSGIELNKEFPDVFFIPEKEEKNKLKQNDTVKLIFREDGQVERMWVLIKKEPQLKDNILYFTGELHNEPYGLETIKFGDIVNFTEDHIIDIESTQ